MEKLPEPKRIFDLLDRYKHLFSSKQIAFANKTKAGWIHFSTQDYLETTKFLSIGLLASGVKAGDTVATITNNRAEWNFLDMALMQIGAIQVPIYPTISELNYRFIFDDASIKWVFIANEEIYRKIANIYGDLRTKPEIYAFDTISNAESWEAIVEKGKQHANEYNLEAIINNITEHDIVSIIYTSGTTGNPKGAMLTHKNICSNFLAVAPISGYTENHRALSFLPLCHIYERMLNYMYQYLGMSIYYAQNIDTVGDDLKEAKPHMFCAVPRVFEKFYNKIEAKGRTLGWLERNIFFAAIRFGENYEPFADLPFHQKIKLRLFRRLVFKKWLEAMGGSLEIIVSGSASLQERLARIFWAAGIEVLEGYGLTETSPVIAVSKRGKGGSKIGTVGPILEGVSVKIADDGEILCKGPNVMQGYYKRPELTAEVIDKEGWFHTGDIGTFVDNTFLKITDRKKEMFKTSGGKYIAPQVLESRLKESPFIEYAFVVGDNKPCAAALIVPSFKHLQSWCEVKKIPFTTAAEMIKMPIIKERIFREVEKANQYFDKTEQIKTIELLAEDWSVENGELSPTLKPRRKFIYEKYKCQIERLYSK